MKIKGSTTPEYKKNVGVKAQVRKCVETLKKTMSVMLKTQNSQVLGRYLPEKEIFQVRDQTWPVANLPVVDFRSQPREMPSPKPLNT